MEADVRQRFAVRIGKPLGIDQVLLDGIEAVVDHDNDGPDAVPRHCGKTGGDDLKAAVAADHGRAPRVGDADPDGGPDRMPDREPDRAADKCVTPLHVQARGGVAAKACVMDHHPILVEVAVDDAVELLAQCDGDRLIDDSRRILGACHPRRERRDFLEHREVRQRPAGGMGEQDAVAALAPKVACAGAAIHNHHGAALDKGSGDSVDQAERSDAIGDRNGGKSAHPCVAVGRVTRIELAVVDHGRESLGRGAVEDGSARRAGDSEQHLDAMLPHATNDVVCDCLRHGASCWAMNVAARRPDSIPPWIQE